LGVPDARLSTGVNSVKATAIQTGIVSVLYVANTALPKNSFTCADLAANTMSTTMIIAFLQLPPTGLWQFVSLMPFS
jgi:hypothetical protein